MLLPILYTLISPLLGFFWNDNSSQVQKNPSMNVIAYYSGDENKIDQYDINKLTHIIYSFAHLKGNKLDLRDKQILIVKKLVALKKKHSQLKIMVALGGWGGCEPCSDAFSTSAGRNEFAQSVKQMITDLQIDGIDLDWEYPAVQGPPGHKFKAEDKENFTELVLAIRKTIGKDKEISFAAGGFPEFLQQSIEWDKVMPLVDRVNIMTYDLVNGNSDTTGHQTSLFSTKGQSISADQAIKYLGSIKVPANKMVIGMAFYARIFKLNETTDAPLFKPATFQTFLPYRQHDNQLSTTDGYQLFWDSEAAAPYSYNPNSKMFATYDNKRSVALKTEYAIKHQLNGVMFWEMTLDAPKDGLLFTIDSTLHTKR